jgi:hypothetical protein
MEKINIKKASGEFVFFQEEKLLNSLKKAGATDAVAAEINSTIKQSLFPGISTKEIYARAFALLRKTSRPTAARYKLKKAIMELGETGYPFEKFVGALLRAEGFRTQVGVTVRGKCVSHEVDVIAEKDNLHYMCECKFHNLQNRRCDVKIPLYIQSRFKDLEAAWSKKIGHSNKFHQGWIFTNTRFTSDALQYGSCAGLQLISWDYPNDNALKERVDRTGIHPITCLTTLSKREKKALIELGIITSKELCQNPEKLNVIIETINRHTQIIEEAKALSYKSSETNGLRK